MSVVVVTRPEPKNAELCQAVRTLGYTAISLPLISIEPLRLDTDGQVPQEVRQSIINIDQYQGVIVVSRPAAQWLSEAIEQYWPQLPIGVQWLAVGLSSASVLEAISLPVTVSKERFDSEGLLALELLQAEQVQEQKWLLVKGQGGRALLADTLQMRGAIVEAIEVYQRKVISVQPEQCAPIVDAMSRQQTVISTATSQEILQTYWNVLTTHFEAKVQDWWLQQPLIVVSQRVADLAYSLGFTKIIVAEEPGNNAIVKALTQVAST